LVGLRRVSASGGQSTSIPRASSSRSGGVPVAGVGEDEPGLLLDSGPPHACPSPLGAARARPRTLARSHRPEHQASARRAALRRRLARRARRDGCGPGRDLRATGSVALLADLIHNFGDALTALPLGTAFLFRSARAERSAGLAVVLAIFISACVAAASAIEKIMSPHAPEHLLALGLAGAIGFLGNEVVALVRLRAGRRLDSPALVADGYHARTDGFVSLGVMLSAALW